MLWESHQRDGIQAFDDASIGSKLGANVGSMNGVDLNDVIRIFLQAEMLAVVVVLHVFTAVRIGAKVMALAVISVRRDYRELRNSMREISSKTRME